jgi:hypothetical protein
MNAAGVSFPQAKPGLLPLVDASTVVDLVGGV